MAYKLLLTESAGSDLDGILAHLTGELCSPAAASELLDAACRDKKIAGSRLNLVVPRAIGRCEIMPIDTAGLSAWLRDGGAK